MLMSMPDNQHSNFLCVDKAGTIRFTSPIMNIGMGEDSAILVLAVLIKDVVVFEGRMFDTI
jgi:hypothetical protein